MEYFATSITYSTYFREYRQKPFGGPTLLVIERSEGTHLYNNQQYHYDDADGRKRGCFHKFAVNGRQLLPPRPSHFFVPFLHLPILHRPEKVWNYSIGSRRELRS